MRKIYYIIIIGQKFHFTTERFSARVRLYLCVMYNDWTGIRLGDLARLCVYITMIHIMSVPFFRFSKNASRWTHAIYYHKIIYRRMVAQSQI